MRGKGEEGEKPAFYAIMQEFMHKRKTQPTKNSRSKCGNRESTDSRTDGTPAPSTKTRRRPTAPPNPQPHTEPSRTPTSKDTPTKCGTDPGTPTGQQGQPLHSTAGRTQAKQGNQAGKQARQDGQPPSQDERQQGRNRAPPPLQAPPNRQPKPEPEPPKTSQAPKTDSHRRNPCRSCCKTFGNPFPQLLAVEPRDCQNTPKHTPTK